jgi:hypothetical protein
MLCVENDVYRTTSAKDCLQEDRNAHPAGDMKALSRHHSEPVSGGCSMIDKIQEACWPIEAGIVLRHKGQGRPVVFRWSDRSNGSTHRRPGALGYETRNFLS